MPKIKYQPVNTAEMSSEALIRLELEEAEKKRIEELKEEEAEVTKMTISAFLGERPPAEEKTEESSQPMVSWVEAIGHGAAMAMAAWGAVVPPLSLDEQFKPHRRS